MDGREKWICAKCEDDRLIKLQEDLQNALRQIDELKTRNNELEKKILMVGAGKMDMLPVKQKSARCMVVGDSLARGIGAEHMNMMVECLPGIKSELLHKVIERGDLGCPETVIIHVGTNDLKSTQNLDWIMGEIYALVTTAKVKFLSCRLDLNGVLRRSDVSWWRIGALNDRLDWVAEALGITFVDPNSWIDDNDFARDGLHLSGRGKSRLGQLFARVSDLDTEAVPVSDK
jgi:hypothetical protein